MSQWPFMHAHLLLYWLCIDEHIIIVGVETGRFLIYNTRRQKPMLSHLSCGRL